LFSDQAINYDRSAERLEDQADQMN